MEENELVLAWDRVIYVPESCVCSRLARVELDYESGLDPAKFQDPEDDEPPKPLLAPELPECLFVRRMIRYEDAEKPEGPFFPFLCQTHPLRGELELKQFGREHFEKWDSTISGTRCISIPLLIFIDGFGVYRNSYRTLMGIYVIPAGLSAKERSRRANVFPIALGPHGSNFDEVIEALASLRPLDKGINTTLNGEDIFLAVFCLCFIGDMIQQLLNTGIKGIKSNLNCRFCFAGDSERGDLAYDIHENGRYHFLVQKMRGFMSSLPAGKGSKREKYSSKWGLDATLALASITPALDIISTRPSDPAHLEYQGLSQLMHQFLKDTLLTEKGLQEYHVMLRKFPFPPGWQRLPSPIHYLGSYSLSEHARWSVVILVLLRKWLQTSHVKSKFLLVARQRWDDPLEFIVSAFAKVAKSNTILMGAEISEEDRRGLNDIVFEARDGYQ
jgi:hypothetical protein